MTRNEEIEVMSKKDNPHTERLELAKHLQGLSEEEYNQTVTSVDNDRRNWGDGAWYGAHWADEHTSDETIEKIGLIAIDWITNIGGNNMVEYIRQHLNDDTTNK